MSRRPASVDIAHKIRDVLKAALLTTSLSMLYTSHNMQEMEAMSDRIIFLQRGKIVAGGTAAEIVARSSRQFGRGVLKLAEVRRKGITDHAGLVLGGRELEPAACC